MKISENIIRQWVNKTYIFIFFVLLASHSFAFDKSLADSAVSAYSRGDYNTAILKYQQIFEQGYHSSGMYYNLGNCYYKLGQYPRAILNFERALRLDAQNEDAAFNLQMAQRFITDKIDILPEFFLRKWLKDTINYYPSDKWAKNSVIAFLLVLFFMGVFFFTRSRKIKKLSFFIAVISIIISILSGYFSFEQKNYATDNSEAIVLTPSVTVKSTPDQGGTDLFLIHEGIKVKIIDQVDTWVEIKLANGNKGWMKEEGLERI